MRSPFSTWKEASFAYASIAQALIGQSHLAQIVARWNEVGVLCIFSLVNSIS